MENLEKSKKQETDKIFSDKIQRKPGEISFEKIKWYVEKISDNRGYWKHRKNTWWKRIN